MLELGSVFGYMTRATVVLTANMVEMFLKLPPYISISVCSIALQEFHSDVRGMKPMRS